jgi:hypothetical protein
MSATRLRAALVDRAAAQWTALGVTLQAPAERTVVDLEALIGLTATVGGADARVWRGAIAWCGRHGRFVNSSRLKRVVAEMRVTGDDLAEFATAARRAGAPSWLAAGATGRSAGDRGARDSLVVLRPTRDASRLLWHLRATFGVNARADIVAHLVARPGSSLTVLELANLTRFTKRNTAVALEDLRLAAVVERQGGSSLGRFRLRDPSGLLRWLDQPNVVSYPDWVAQFAVGTGVLALLGASAQSERVRAIEARRVVTGLRAAIERADLPGPDLAATGTAFAEAFDAWVESLATRWEAAA